MYIVFMLKQPPGGHFEFLILDKLHPYGMLVINSNMLTQYENNRTCSIITMVMNRQMHFYREKGAEKTLGGHFEFPISAEIH